MPDDGFGGGGVPGELGRSQERHGRAGLPGHRRDLVVVGRDDDLERLRHGERLLDGPHDQGLAGHHPDVLAGHALAAAAGRDDADARHDGSSTAAATATAGSRSRRGRRGSGVAAVAGHGVTLPELRQPRRRPVVRRPGRHPAGRGLEDAGREHADHRRRQLTQRNGPVVELDALAAPARVLPPREPVALTRVRPVAGALRAAERAGEPGHLTAAHLGAVQLAQEGRAVVGHAGAPLAGLPQQLGADHLRLHVGAARPPEVGVGGRPGQQRGVGGERRRVGSEQAVLHRDEPCSQAPRPRVGDRAERQVVAGADHHGSPTTAPRVRRPAGVRSVSPASRSGEGRVRGRRTPRTGASSSRTPPSGWWAPASRGRRGPAAHGRGR